MTVAVGDGEALGWPTAVVIAASAGDRPAPVTVTVRVAGAPGAADVRTWSATATSKAWSAGSEPSEQAALRGAGHRVYCGAFSEDSLDATVTVTSPADTVDHTQSEYFSVPPGADDDPRSSCALTQSAPAWCDLLGEGLGDGLGEFDGELDGEPAELSDGLGLCDTLELGDVLGESAGLEDWAGLGVSDGLAASDGAAVGVLVAASRVAEIALAEPAAPEPAAHGDPSGAACATDAASAGAAA